MELISQRSDASVFKSLLFSSFSPAAGETRRILTAILVAMLKAKPRPPSVNANCSFFKPFTARTVTRFCLLVISCKFIKGLKRDSEDDWALFYLFILFPTIERRSPLFMHESPLQLRREILTTVERLGQASRCSSVILKRSPNGWSKTNPQYNSHKLTLGLWFKPYRRLTR